MQITTAILAAQPFLKGLIAQQLDTLMSNAMAVEFPADKLIFREGQLANRFFLILEGEVAVESSAGEENGNASLIQTVGAGGVLGWSWLFPPYFWHFDARAVTPVKAIFFYGTRLREQCENDHELGYELMKRMNAVVVERLQATRHRLSEQNKSLLLAI
jgi:CRP-like cAMP-binding protein